MCSSVGRLIALIALLVLTRVASAAPSTRIVLVDRDPELRRSVASVLEPWRIEVVLDQGTVDEAQAQARAEAMNARFVIWREHGQLVVFDRERVTAERRDASDGALDPVSAAGVALTVKTMLRLPPLPPPEPEQEPPPAVTAASPSSPGFDVRLQTGIAMRIARGSETELGARFTFAALAHPWSSSGWRVGIAGDLGTASSFQRAGLTGTWSDWAALAVASWTAERGAWEIEPWLAGGVTRSSMRSAGTGMAMSQSDTTFLPAARGGGTVRLRVGAWSAGVSLGAEATIGAPTYTKVGTSAALFEVPWFAAVAGVVVAAELGR
jgi:hypothetical protein